MPGHSVFGLFSPIFLLDKLKRIANLTVRPKMIGELG